ncbi:hypothetical protein NL676_025419 [Syzygium grande]|nr:hypothetical protein NL676_025419 [Syzygium grande]
MTRVAIGLTNLTLTHITRWAPTGPIQYQIPGTSSVFGCDTLALVSDAAGTFGTGCFSDCREDINFIAKSACSGLGFCQTSIGKSLRSFNISMASLMNYTSVRNFSSCGSAFVVDQELFNVSDYKLPVPDDMRKDFYLRVVRSSTEFDLRESAIKPIQLYLQRQQYLL